MVEPQLPSEGESSPQAGTQHRESAGVAGVLVVGLGGHVLHVDTIAAALLRSPPESLVGHSVFQIFERSDAGGRLDVLRAAVRNGREVDVPDLSFERMDGTRITLSASVSPVRTKGETEERLEGAILSLRSAGQPASGVAGPAALVEGKWLEAVEKNARHAAELLAILDSMVVGVYVLAPDGRVSYSNEAGARLLGLPLEQVEGHDLGIFVERLRMRDHVGAPLPQEKIAIARALAGETVLEQEKTWVNQATMRDLHVRVSAAPVRDQNGRIVGAVEVARDVTELLELDRLKEEFIRAAAHELKTPVTVVKGFAQALLREGKDRFPEQRNLLEAIDRGADRIHRIVQDLVDLSRMYLDRLEPITGPVDLADVVVAARASVPEASQRARVVRLDHALVVADRNQLQRVVAELVANAIRYSPDGSDVEIELAALPSEAVVSVRDRGIGIPADRQPHVFERFYRAHAGTPWDYGGMGVGLSIAREIVRRHGGRIWFESEERKGSTFHFAIPMRSGNGTPA